MSIHRLPCCAATIPARDRPGDQAPRRTPPRRWRHRRRGRGRGVILVDAALRRRAEEGRPVRLAIVGAGTMGTKGTLQVTTATPGMDVVAISNRHPERAEAAFRAVGHDDLAAVGSVAELERAIAQGRPAVTDAPGLLCEAEYIDVVMDATGTIEFGAGVVSAAIAHGKHV